MKLFVGSLFVFFQIAVFVQVTIAKDLPQIKQSGVIRHIGVPYANFVTGSGDGMSVELVKGFAKYIGVRYEYIEASWSTVIQSLTGKKIKTSGGDIQIIGNTTVKGDIIANGFTILSWRKKIVDFSNPTFPTQVWILAGADSPIHPIVPSGDINQDIKAVKEKLNGLSVLGVANTCLDPGLYKIRQTGAFPRLFKSNLNQLAPAVINGEAQTTLLDVPDALIALEKWPGKIKVIGPVSRLQEMGAAFAKDAPLLKESFNGFLQTCKSNGTFLEIVKRYYPIVLDYYPKFFQQQK